MDFYRQINRREMSQLETKYFSADNICKIHKGILDNVLMVTGNSIHQQDNEDLVFFMYEILNTYNHLNDTQESLEFLNIKLLNLCVRKIINEMLMYNKYVEDASKLPTLIPRATATQSQRTDDRRVFF